MPFKHSKRITAIICCAVMMAMTACTPSVRFHGYIPDSEELEQIVVGVDTRGTVEDIIGTPTSTGVLNSGGWYYIATQIEHHSYRAPRVIERKMVAVSFDANDVVENIEEFGLQDGNVIPLTRRVTELPVKGPSFWKQILGNVGNFDPAGIIGGN